MTSQDYIVLVGGLLWVSTIIVPWLYFVWSMSP